MKTTRFDAATRHAVLGVAIALLVLMAGCSSFLADGNPPAEETAHATGTQTALINNTSGGQSMPANGTDLRSLSISENYSTTVYGEIDGDDPVIDDTNRYYEPIVFAAEAGDTINVSLSSIANDPELRLRNPNGTTVAVDTDSGDGNNAQFQLLELNQTGQYTLVAAAAETNTSFDYTLTAEQWIEPDFYGEPEAWDERSRYLEFTRDYLATAQNLSGGIDGPREEATAAGAQGNLTALGNYTVNTEEDYIVIRYAMERNATPMERISIDAALQNAYYGLYNTYNVSNTAINASWVPDRIYHIGYTYREDELYRTTYLEQEWAVAFANAGGAGNLTARNDYSSRYFATMRFGPAHQGYEENETRSTTPGEVPIETYENVTIDSETDGAPSARP